WLSQGAISGFKAIYGDLLDKIITMAGIETVDEKILAEVSKVSGLIKISKTSSQGETWRKVSEKIKVDPRELYRLVSPLVNAFTVTDHTKCLSFLLSEGVVPSNVREGYLTRLLIRRTYRLLRNLSIEDKMPDIIDMQISRWSKDFPRLKEMRDEILELLAIERDKYEQTLARGRGLVRRVIREQKKEGAAEVPLEKLVELYDSHGLTPEVVSEMAEAEGAKVSVPEDFYSFVAERHVEAPKTVKPVTIEGVDDFEETFRDLPDTRKLYYEDVYTIEFKAKVLRVSGDRVVLEKTGFYPEGGGQPADHGYLEFNGKQVRVVDVQKAGGVIVHFVEGSVPKEGAEVAGVIDWERRVSLMRHHTATHVVMGAARRLLGEHVWQAGAQKDVDRTRLDISHPKRLTVEEINEIEHLANAVVMKNLPVETFWMPREEAERQYGFRLYQGGVVPGREIRIVKTENWEVEACGGTHCKSTGEVGLIKMVRTERIQDGVERLIFSAGASAVEAVQEIEAKVSRVAELLEVPTGKVDQVLERMVSEWTELRRDKERLTDNLAKFMAEKYLSTAKEVSGLKTVSKIVDAKDADVDLLIKVSNELVKLDKRAIPVLVCIDDNARIVVMVGEEARKLGVDAREIAREAASELGGGGSGRPEFAQGGGTRVECAAEALKKAKMVIRRKVEG
ncbi:MAG: alanine--tRNA ligase, partial [Candidatus Bathyarchaeota archaeon]|nr:alanine--tRNA ligase [Candidatus Bathyarchaeota archaeon]